MMLQNGGCKDIEEPLHQRYFVSLFFNVVLVSNIVQIKDILNSKQVSSVITFISVTYNRIKLISLFFLASARFWFSFLRVF
jgi:hypothetical protein